MKKRLAVVAAGAWLLMAAVPAIAHHSFAAEFDANKPFKMTGTVTKVEWMNPHTYFYIDVKDEKTGKVTNWAMEMGSPNGLMRQGWTRNTMKIGDEVTVEGSLAKDGSQHRQRALGDAGGPASGCSPASSQGNHAVARVRPLKDSLRTALSRRRRWSCSLTTACARASAAVAVASAAGTAGSAPQPSGTGPAAAAAAATPDPPQPTPRLADGTVNLGRVPGEKGIWNVPYITNMGDARRRRQTAQPRACRSRPSARPARGARRRVRRAPLGGGEGGGGGGRGGTKSEPWMPLQPWAAAVYDYNSEERVQVRPGRLLPAAGRSAHDGDALPDGDHPAAGAEAHRHDLRRRARTSGARSTWTAASIRRATR